MECCKENLSSVLLASAHNVYSQYGEDGIINAILEVIGTMSRWCVDVGASDGIHLSNTRRLVEQGWDSVLIERSRKKYDRLCSNSPDSYCVHAKVTHDGINSLDAILGMYKIPAVFDLLSLDIDGQEYHVWNGMTKHIARVVIIEFKYQPEASNTDSIVPIDGVGQSGQSAMEGLAKKKGYAVVAVTKCNLICVKNHLLKPLEDYYAAN